jgi:hypothetical protein
MPGPAFIRLARSATPSVTSSKALPSTYSRDAAEQTWPWLKKIARLAAQFQRHLLQVARGSPDDAFADRGGAGESDLVNPSVYSCSGHDSSMPLRVHRTIVVARWPDSRHK